MSEPSLNTAELRQLLKDVLTETLNEQRDLLRDIFAEVIEDVGLTEAIKEGSESEVVDREEVMKILEGGS